jgi:hypothetical protein
LKVIQKPAFKASGFLDKACKEGHILINENVNSHCDYDPTSDSLNNCDSGPTMIVVMYDDEEKAFALIRLRNGEEGPTFTKEDFNFIDTICSIAYNSIKHSENFDDIEEATQQMNDAVEISRLVTSEVEVSSIISKIIAVATESLKAEKISVFLVNSKKPDELIVETSEDVKGLTVPVSAGIVGHVATTGMTLNIPDAYLDARFNADMDSKCFFLFIMVMITSH